MRRREFIALVGGAAASPLVAWAQQPTIPLIGYLEGAPREQFASVLSAFRKGLSEAGYIEGQTVGIDYRWADGDYSKLAVLATELAQGRAALIFATSFVSAQMAKRATTNIPVVFVSGPDPVQLGLVTSLSRPGGNLTGVTLFTSVLTAKRLELLRELVPAADTLAFLVNPVNTRTDSDIQEMVAAARGSGHKVMVLTARTDHELEAELAKLPQAQIRALIVGGDPFFNSHAEQLVALAARHAIPTIYPLREFVTAGGLISYGSSIADAYRQAGVYAGRILHGTKPGDLPIIQPAKFELTINLKTSRALGLTVPPNLLARADEVIE